MTFKDDVAGGGEIVNGGHQGEHLHRYSDRSTARRLTALARSRWSFRMVGFAEGHYPWDLGSSSMMTNKPSLQKVHAIDGETVSVTYKGGERKMPISPNVPIVALVPADKSDIKPGAIVLVPTEKQADGTLLSGAILFGKDGVVPPM